MGSGLATALTVRWADVLTRWSLHGVGTVCVWCGYGMGRSFCTSGGQYVVSFLPRPFFGHWGQIGGGWGRRGRGLRGPEGYLVVLSICVRPLRWMRAESQDRVCPAAGDSRARGHALRRRPGRHSSGAHASIPVGITERLRHRRKRAERVAPAPGGPTGTRLALEGKVHRKQLLGGGTDGFGGVVAVLGLS